MTPQYILRKSLCRPPHCFSAHVKGEGYVNNGSNPDSKADYDRQRIKSAESEIENLGFAPAYSEPGYTQPEKGILFANWNVFPRNIDRVLERGGWAIEWSDEWSTCSDCGHAVRTIPDSYSWLSSYVILNECDLLCRDCVLKNPDEYEDYLRNDSDRADQFGVDWESRGYVRFNPDHYQSGFHLGQNDKPSEIVKQLPKDHDFIFTIPSKGQFDIQFDVWIKPQTVEA